MEEIDSVEQEQEQVHPIYCARCFHTFGVEPEKEDDDEDSEVSEDTEDEDSVAPLFEEDPDVIEERILEEIDERVQQNPLRLSKPHVERDLINEVVQSLYEEWSEEELCDECDLPEIRTWVGVMVSIYFDTQVPRRQGGCAAPLTPLKRATIARKIHLLDNVKTPPQRTQEWYEMRYNMITASNLYKALGSEAQQNQLIVEKCQAFDQFKADCSRHGNLSADNPMAHGTKYEAISAMIYEKQNQTRLGEYGCMIHPEWPFLGASPDGINVDPEAATYGRMVEIKNIVNREIDGIPLEHYWVQMQTQMEVCDLDECDFVETRIKEFAGKDAYLESENPWKGVVLTFTPRILIGTIPSEKLPGFYEHWIQPLASVQEQPLADWVLSKKTEHKEKYVLQKTDYWGLDQYSCVLVLRNRLWFEAAIKRVESLWRIVEVERVQGCEHRAPKKRMAKAQKVDTTELTVVKLESEPVKLESEPSEKLSGEPNESNNCEEIWRT
jgi:putative phage-type endonuclease